MQRSTELIRINKFAQISIKAQHAADAIKRWERRRRTACAEKLSINRGGITPATAAKPVDRQKGEAHQTP